MPRPSRAARLAASPEPSSQTPAGRTPIAWSSCSTSCRELDSLVSGLRADDRELDAAGQQPPENLAAGRDLDVDRDSRIVAAEAAERVGQDVDAGRSRGAEANRAHL